MPVLSIIGGLLSALVSVVYLVYFFHHIAESLQVENILQGIEAETLPALRRLYPQSGEDPDDEDGETLEEPKQPAVDVPCRKAGYIQQIELNNLLKTAERADAVIYVPHCVGDFIVQGKALATVFAEPVGEEKLIEEISTAFSLGVQRSIQQDPAFGIRQMADVGLKALSPGVNDTTNAIMALDRISVLMTELSSRCFPQRRRMQNGKLRLVVYRPGFDDLLGLSFDQLRQWGSANPAVLYRLLEVLGDLARASANSRRQALVRSYAQRVLATAETHIKDAEDLHWIKSCYRLRIERLSA